MHRYMNIDSTAAGFVIRNHEATVLCAGGKLLSSYSAPLAELRVAYSVDRDLLVK